MKLKLLTGIKKSSARIIAAAVLALGAFAAQAGAPKVTLPTSVTVLETTGTNAVTNLSVTVADTATNVALTNVSLTVTSGNTTLVSNAGLVVSGTGASRSIAITPNESVFGSVTITVVSTDSQPVSSTNTFTLKISLVDQPPSYDLSTNEVVVAEESGLTTKTAFVTNLSAGPASQSSQTWKFVATTVTGNATNAAFTTSPAVSTNGTLTFTTKAHSYGTNLVTLVMTNSGGTADGGDDGFTNSFLIAVAQINHAPTITPVSSITLLENVSNTVTLSVNVWDYDQQSSNIVLTATSSNTNQESVAVSTNVTLPSATNATFTVTLSLTDNVYGIVTNQLVATKNGLSTTNTFLLTVSHVNQAPHYAFNTNVVVSNLFLVGEETPSVSSAGFLTSLSAGPPDEISQSWKFTVTTATGQATNALFKTAPAIATNGTLTFSPKAHSYGTNLVTVVMTDSGGTAAGGVSSYTNTFLLGVIQTNHAPSITGIGNLTVLENASNTVIVSVGVWDYDQKSSNFVLTASSSNTNLETVNISTNVTVQSPSNAVYTMTLTLASNQYGVITNQLVATEGPLSTTNTFKLTISHVNQAPSFSFNTNVVVSNIFSTAEEVLSVTNLGFLTNLSAGPADESSQTWKFTVTTARNAATNAAFTVLPAIATNGTLTFRPKVHSYGTNLVTVVMTDNGGIANHGVNSCTNTFLLAVVQTNHAPTIVKVPSQTMLENQTNITVSISVWNYDQASTNFTLTASSSNTNFENVVVSTNVTIVNSTNALFTLTLSVPTNQFGVVTNQLVASEGPLSSTNTFKVTVTHVNQAPGFSFNTNVVISNMFTAEEEIVSVTNIGFLTNLSAGPTNENNQTWKFVVTTASGQSTNAVFTGAPAIATNGTLTFRPKTHSYGTNLVTVVMTDNGGTANKGVNSSTNTFLLAIVQTNHAPNFFTVSNITVLENATNFTASINVWDYDQNSSNCTLTATSLNTNLENVTVSTNVSHPSLTNAVFTLTMSLPTNQFGFVTNRLVATEDGFSTTNTFLVTITHVNQAPSFGFNTNVVISNMFSAGEETVAVTNIGFLTNLSAGPINENNQTWNFTLTTATNQATNAQFTILPAIATNGTLTFRPKAHSYGTNLVTVVMTDNGGTANGGVATSTNTFLLAVTQTNHAPSFFTVSNVTVLENATNYTATISVWNYDQKSSNFVLTATSPNTNLETIAVSTNVTIVNSTNAIFTATLSFGTNQYGVVSNQLVASEGELSTTNTFTVTVTHVNQAPSYHFNTNVVVSNMFASEEEVLAVTNIGFLTNLSAGPTNESTQTWAFTVTTATNQATNALFTIAPAISTNGTLTYHPKAHSYGTNLVTVVMIDNGGTSNGGVDAFTNTFLLAVVQTNHAPSFNTVSNLTVLENATNFTTTVSIWNYDQQSSNFVLTATSSNTNVETVTVSTNVSLPNSTNAVFTLSLGVLTNQFGLITNQLVATEGALSTTNIFTVDVLHVNQAPSFGFNSNVVTSNVLVVPENTGATNISAFLASLLAGPTNENSQTWAFTLSTVTTNATNATLTTNFSIATNGNLKLTASSNSFGTNTVIVVMTDNGGTANGGINATTNTFQLQVPQIWYPPQLTGITNKTILENGTTNLTLGFTLYNHLDTNFTVTADSSDTNLATVEAVVTGSNCTLTVVPVTNQNGTATITVTASADSLTNSTNFTLTVTPVNQAPSFDLAVSSITVDQYNVAVTVPAAVTNISAGPTNESSQTVSFTVTNSNSALFQSGAAPAINSSGTLTFTPAATGGTVTVGIKAVDNGGTNNGGVNTSPVQTMTIVIPANTFSGVSGIYAGLFYDTNTIANASSGYFNLVLATNGAFTGYALGAGESNAFTGQFDISNDYASVTASSLTLDLTIDTSTNQAISGTVSNSSWDSALQAYRAGFSASSHTSLAGSYIMTMSGFEDPTAGPAGDSVFSISVSNTGVVSLTGTMADDTAAAQHSQLSQQGYYPLYIPLYSSGALGSLIGWLDFNGGSPDALSTNSAVTWFDLSGATSLYPGGFTNQAIAVASAYNSGATSILSFSSGSVVLSGGNLATNLTNTITVSNNIIIVSPATNGLSLTIDSATGGISGSFVDPSDSHTNTIYGAILQDTNICPGFFIGTSQGGSFILTGD